MNDMKKKIMTMAMMALAFTACTEEDLMQPTQGDAGTLHITSVTIDGQDMARTRLVADDKEYIMSHLLPYNQSFNGFTAGDWLVLDINNLYAEDTQGGSIKANYSCSLFASSFTFSKGRSVHSAIVSSGIFFFIKFFAVSIAFCSAPSASATRLISES